MKNEIINIANTYMDEHNGELPLLIVARNKNENRIIRCHLREKHAQSDQSTFINVMRLAMIIYKYTDYEFVVKPEFDYEELQMTKDIWAVGHVTPKSQVSEFFELVDGRLEPYFEEMPIGGYIAQLLPSEREREQIINPKAVKQIKLYIENSTYHLPVKEEKESDGEDGLDALFAIYK